jgi:hypothetical protein
MVLGRAASMKNVTIFFVCATEYGDIEATIDEGRTRFLGIVGKYYGEVLSVELVPSQAVKRN